jgi:hypothetical protein
MLYFVRLEYFLGTQRRVYFILTPEQLAPMAEKLLRLYISLITFSSHQPAMAFNLFSITVTEPEPDEDYELASISEFEELPMLRPEGWDRIYLEIDYLREDGDSVDSGLCLSLDDILVEYPAFFEEFFRHTSGTPQQAGYYYPSESHLLLCICTDHYDHGGCMQQNEGLLQAE